MNNMKNISQLKAKALDWAVAKAQGLSEQNYVRIDNLYGPQWDGPEYSVDWAFAGPIIEANRINIEWRTDAHFGKLLWLAICHNKGSSCGDTPLEAAMRAYVMTCLGEWIEVPADLLNPLKAAA